MSGADEFWCWWWDKEEAEIAKAQRLKRLKIHEASLVDRGANPHAEIVFYKSAGARQEDEMDELEKHLRELEPGLAWETNRQAAYGEAVAKHAGDAVVAHLYEVVKHDGPAAAVEKSAEEAPGDWVWRRVEFLAKRLRAGEPGLSEAAAIQEVLEQRPDLAAGYRDEYWRAQG